MAFDHCNQFNLLDRKSFPDCLGSRQSGRVWEREVCHAKRALKEYPRAARWNEWKTEKDWERIFAKDWIISMNFSPADLLL